MTLSALFRRFLPARKPDPMMRLYLSCEGPAHVVIIQGKAAE